MSLKKSILFNLQARDGGVDLLPLSQFFAHGQFLFVFFLPLLFQCYFIFISNHVADEYAILIYIYFIYISFH